MTTTGSTPMVRQYQELKSQHPGTLLFFRLGDFYELFFDDAVIGARELQITLTARHKERGDPIPMCGVPHHSAANYIARLVRRGYRVAICEQTEDAAKTKKLVRREVVRIVTPGTPIDPQLLEPRESTFLAAVCARGENVGAAFLDISTGEFRATQSRGSESWIRIAADIESFAPRELLFPASLAPLVRAGFGNASKTEALPLSPLPVSGEGSGVESATQPASLTTSSSAHAVTPHPNPLPAGEGIMPNATLTPLDDWLWQAEDAENLLIKHFGVQSLDGFGLTGKTEAIMAAAACLKYAQETQRASAAHIRDIVYFEPQDHLVLDNVTVRNLELVQALGAGGAARSLLDVIDQTVTGMGARLLRAWLLRPSIHRLEVEARQAAVAEFHGSHIKRDGLRNALKEVADLERLTGRLNLGSATPRDLHALRTSLDRVPGIRRLLVNAESSLLQVLHESLDELADVRTLIESSIEDDPPAKVVDGGVIRSGYSPELDAVRSLGRN
ncbi:MAG TPA: hypothetical protein VE961_19505, partial [Pyrinomonadaceae bacterium]|nr:hypothetical protein [Pyrinomonadaceae bacterium]